MAAGPLAPVCWPTATHTEPAVHYGYSGNTAAVIGVVICLVLLAWWLRERTRPPAKEE